MSETLLYLRLLARVRPDNTVRSVRTQLSETPGRFDAEAHPRIAWTELYADNGQLLLRWPVAGGPECVLSRERHHMPDLLMRSHIPLPARARKLRLMRDGIVLTEMKIAPEPPAAELTWPLEGLHRVIGRHEISWRSNTAPVDAFLRYSTDDGRSWLRIG